MMFTPSPGETRNEFIERCTSALLDDGTARDGQEAIAILGSLYDRAKSEEQ